MVDSTRADEAVIEQLGNPEALDQYGALTLFIETWCTEPTFQGAVSLITDFDLEDYSRSATALESEYDSVYKLFDDLELDLTNKIIRQLNASSKLIKAGGVYSTGWKGRDFGLKFSASAEELEALNKRKDKLEEDLQQKVATLDAIPVAVDLKASCIRDALSHIRQVDFGRHSADDLRQLMDAKVTLERCGVESKDLDMSLKNFKTNIDMAKDFVYGPSGRGTGLGAIVDLTNMADQLENGTSTGELRSAAPQFVIFAGHRYERIDQETAARLIEAKKKKTKKEPSERKDTPKGGNKTTGPKRTPKHMKGVEKCKAKDIDPDRPPAEQEWCTYDFRGNLRGRHRSRNDAIEHKLFLVNMYWSRGKGRNRKDRPTNKPVLEGPRRKK